MDNITLTLRPDAGLPPDLPFRALHVDVPLHPLAGAVNTDAFWGTGFPIVAYRSCADPVSYAIPISMEDAVTWYGELFSREVYTYWTALDVSPAGNSDLTARLTFRSIHVAAIQTCLAP